MSDDFDFADLGHHAQVLALGAPKKFRGVDFRDIQRRQLPRSLARRRLLEDQPFVLIDVTGGFRGGMLHRTTSSIACSPRGSSASLSASTPTAVSIEVRV